MRRRDRSKIFLPSKRGASVQKEPSRLLIPQIPLMIATTVEAGVASTYYLVVALFSIHRPRDALIVQQDQKDVATNMYGCLHGVFALAAAYTMPVDKPLSTS